MTNPVANACKYHSSKSAVWYCDECAINYCSDCVVITADNASIEPRCHLCQNRMDYQGVAASAPKFWTVSHQFFKYPFGVSGIALIGLVAFLGVVGQVGPLLGLFALFLILAVVVKYCFAVLEQVALGDMVTPSVSEAVSGDEDNLFLQFAGIILAVGLMQMAADVLAGPGIGTFVSIVFTIFTPAMAIYLAIDKSIVSALNVGKIVNLIRQIGPPYALVVFLWNVISTGPYLMYSVFGEALEGSMFALPVFSALCAYFAVVLFAMLGYVMYENQDKFGYVSGDQSEVAVSNTPQNKRKQIFGQINVLLKENRSDEALRTLERCRAEFSSDTVYCDRYLALALQLNDSNAIDALANPYLEMLLGQNAKEQALDVWRKIAKQNRAFRPNNPNVSHTLAETAYGKNLLNEALALLGNLHKRNPDYANLVAAYELAIKVLQEKGDDAQAQKLTVFIDQIKLRPSVEATQPESALSIVDDNT